MDVGGAMNKTRMKHIALKLLLLLAVAGSSGQAIADTVTFEPFVGAWDGDGAIRFGDGAKERMRCSALYELRQSSGRALHLSFNCKSDKYAFVLDGNVSSDASGTLSGQWSETSRNIGGTVIGKVRGQRFQVRIESSGFGANLVVVLQDNRQRINIDSGGGGEEAQAQITLRRKRN